MKRNNLFGRIALSGLACLVMVACQKEADDEITPHSLEDDLVYRFVEEETVYPGNTRIFNLTEHFNLGVEVTARLHQQPVHGKAELLGRNLVAYTPDPDFTSGSDHFTYMLMWADSGMYNGRIDIQMAENTDSLCGTSLNDVYLETDVNTPVSFSIQDKLDTCGLSMVEVEPYVENNGSLSCCGDPLTYTPDADFTGEDYFVYRVKLDTDPVSYVFGYGEVMVRADSLDNPDPDCVVQANPDSIYLAPATPGYHLLDVLVNDSFCEGYELSLLKPATHGVVVSVDSSGFWYEADTSHHEVVDTIRYRLTVGEQSDSAEVLIYY